MGHCGEGLLKSLSRLEGLECYCTFSFESVRRLDNPFTLEKMSNKEDKAKVQMTLHGQFSMNSGSLFQISTERENKQECKHDLYCTS